MEPDWSAILKERYDLAPFDDLANPVETTAEATPGLFRKANPGPVTCTPLIALGLETTTRGGWYSGVPGAATKELWSYTFKNTAHDLETGENLPPPLADGSTTTFDPGDAAFGLWVANDGLAGIVQSEPRLVAERNPSLAKQPYKAMIYRLTDKDAPNSYLIGWEYSTNDDFQDVVCRVDNVRLVKAAPAAKEPVRLIFDTDLESDVDDVGAVAVLHALADMGEVEILGMGLSVQHAWSAPASTPSTPIMAAPTSRSACPRARPPTPARSTRRASRRSSPTTSNRPTTPPTPSRSIASSWPPSPTGASSW